MSKFLSALYAAVKNNPVLVAGVLNIAVALAAHFGFHVTTAQLTAIVSVATAILALITRATVSPVKAAPVAPPEQAK